MRSHFFLFLLFATVSPTPRVVVTFHNASLNAEAVAPDNMEVVKQYGRRMVLRRTTEDNVTAAWVQEALGGTDYVERIETDVLASIGEGSRRLEADSEQWLNHTVPTDNQTAYVESGAPWMLTNMTGGHWLNHTVPTDNQTAYVESGAPWMLSSITGASLLPTSGWNLDEKEPYALHIQSLRSLTSGRGTVMAIIDSGLAEAAISLFQPAAGYDFISSADYSNKPNQARNPDYTDPGDQGPACPTPSWHGTKVTSIAMAIAPGATLSVMRVLGQCGVGFSSDIADAIVWAAGGRIDGLGANPYPAAAISLSLAGKSLCPSYLQSAVNQARSLGATVIAAAGNAAQNVSQYFPANCIGVIAIGASTRQGTMAPYSNKGVGLAFSAQGGDTANPVSVLTVANGKLALSYATGTSFAAPHATGVMTLLASVDLSFESLAFIRSFGCSTVAGQSACDPILSTVTLNPNRWGLNLSATDSNGTDIVSNNALASTACTGSTSSAWKVSVVINGVIFTLLWPDGTRIEVPMTSGTVKQNLDSKDEEFNCNPGCFITQFIVCPGIEYIIVQCSDGTSSAKFGDRDWGERCTAQQRATVVSSTGFTGIRGIAGGDVNGMEFYKAGGGSQLVGCNDCQTQTYILCGSNPDNVHRVLTGVRAYFTSGGALNAFSLTCSAYACPSNSYLTPNNNVCNLCDTCPGGQYKSGCGGSASGSCLVCGANCGDLQYRAGCGGLSAGYCTGCASCPAGNSFGGCTGGGLSDTRTCALCDAGKYSGGGTSRTCTLCASGKYNPNSGSGSEASCTRCPAGKYNANSGSSVACLSCGTGKYNPDLGAASETACRACNSGYFGANTGAGSLSAGCVACPAGKYTIGAGESTCLLCAAGAYSQTTANIGPASCSACGAGKYSTTLGANAESACVVCPAGKNNPSTGGTSSIISCTFCQPGTNAVSTGQSTCAQCAVGKYSPTTGLSGACTDCGTGKYNAATGGSAAAACQNCMKGSFASEVSRSACQACAAGTYAGAEGMATCTACATGSYTVNTAQSTCQPCVELTTCAVASGSVCVADFGSKCAPCASIYACVYDTNRCFYNGNPSCLCNPGFEMLDGKCIGCVSGKYKSSSGAGLCSPMTSPICVQGTYLVQGTAFANSACVACPPLPSDAVQGLAGCDWSCSAGFDNNAA